MVEILKKITTIRKEKIQKLGFSFGHSIPQERIVPLNPPKFANPLLIAEIKRSSPSSGMIGEIKDPISLASYYLDCGANAISILTEEDHFNGSIKDLIQVKNTFKKTTILRKDFLQFPEEIEISYKIGADMVLIIIAMFLEDKQTFEEILLEIKKYNLTPLFEIHTKEELDFLLPYQPQIIGINMRSLHTFSIHKQQGILLKNQIPEGIKTIFESGIMSDYDGYMIGSSGFDGMLCGSYFVKSKSNTITSLIHSYKKSKNPANRFHKNIFKQLANNKPLIKICGITNLDDALLACKMGANMLGFIISKNSKRYIDITEIKQISRALKTLYPEVLKIGVLLEDAKDFQQAKELCEQNFLDSLQLHAPDNLPYFAKYNLLNANFNFYICINYENLDDYPKNEYLPFILLDSKSKEKGGSGKSIPLEALKELKNTGEALFVAGGIGAHNIQELLNLGVSMLDINSQIEKEIGKKDPQKLQEIFEIINNHYQKL